MSISALTTALLLAGAPSSADGMASAMPALLTDLGPNDRMLPDPTAAKNVTAPVALAEPPPPATRTGLASSTASAVPGPGSDPGPMEIVVTAHFHAPRRDPLEHVNAKTFEATQSVDKAVVGPVAMAYKRGLPKPVRSGLRNVLRNLHEPVVFVNFLLQIKPGKAVETVGRFAINSTIGVAGLIDIAKRHPFNLPYRPNGFADSLGYYGVKPGPFLFLPLIGPTTLRDLLGDTLDRFALPLAFGRLFNRPVYAISATTIRILDHRAEFDEQLRKLREESDPYAAARDFYLKSRQDEIDALHGRHGAAPGSAPARDAAHSVAEEASPTMASEAVGAP